MAEKYLSRVEAILGSPMEKGKIRFSLRWDSVMEARQHLARIRQMQKELRLVKKQVRLTMKQIRSSFRGKKATAQAGFLATLSGRKAAGRNRALKREDLRRKERASLAPYESVVLLIDESLVNLDALKLQLENWITANK